ncbi:MAG: acyl-[ACP]--phospholipid O-acyltransferase [Candidatus Aceula lacicola]|nr:acyl-[ACP]--phospholipid O-acyltransferase [Candidatus Aceula lacicola]
MKNNIQTLGFRSLLATQFLGAFNDNAFKMVIAFIAVDKFVLQSGSTMFLALAGILFALPFFLFSTYAGYLADHFSKRKIIIWMKFLEVFVMAVGLLALISGNIWFIFSVLFLMGTQSALFDPSKYGILPEILQSDEISNGNGRMQMWTFCAIILGQACGGLLSRIDHARIFQSSYIFIAIAALGVFTSFFVTKVEPSGAQRKFQWNFLGELVSNIKLIKPDIGIFRSILGLMYFGFLGGLFHLNILLYARKIMGVEQFPLSMLLVILALGIAVGSFLAGKLSDQKIELGFVPLGAIGLSVFSIILGFVYHSYFNVAICLFSLGICAGFYIVPLNAFLQQYSPPDRKGQFLATSNILICLTGLFASVMLYVFQDVIKLDSAEIFVVAGIVTSVGAIYVCRLLPYSLVRLLVFILTHTIYKMKIIGRNQIPEQGGALLVSNHVSVVDAILVLCSTPRPIRFLVNRDIYYSKVWGPLLRLAKTIPVSHRDRPKQTLESLDLAKNAIRDGELVCVFAEGQLTRTGNILKFKKGLERIMSDVDRPIIPVHIDRVWGSIFSFEGGKYYFKIPKLIPYPITISIGKSMPSNSTSFEVRQKVMDLGSDAFQYRLKDKITLSEAFYRGARSHPFRKCISDSSGKSLNYAMTLVSSVVLENQLKKILGKDKNVGILLPPSVAGVLSNIAVSFLNKVPVNLNYTTSKEAIENILNQCDIKYVVTSRAFLEKIKIDIPSELVFVEDIIKNVSIFEKVKAFLQSFSIPIFMINRIIFKKSHQRSLDDLATIMFTSGSTGAPKGVMLTHFNIISNLEGLYQIFRMNNDEVFMGVLPFFHSFGFTATLWLPLISGTPAVYHYNPLDAKMIGKLVEKHKATILKATPTFLNAYVKRCDSKQFESLRIVVVGAEKLKAQVADAFKEKFNVEPMEGYGCTELSPIVALNLPDYAGPGGRQKAHKFGSIGQPLPGITVKIVDQETFDPVSEGQSGLLLVKGPNIMKGYLNRDDLTREVLREGWYVTGDIAMVDEDGFIVITDRISRFSKIAGEMVPHIKIEEAIVQILGISEQKCVVTSLPDDKKGEKLVVLCLSDVNSDFIVEKLKQSDLPNLWVPSKENFYKVESIPLLGSGKIDLGKIKEIAKNAFQNINNE